MVRIIERLRHECFYHPGKANVVADTLSRMTMGSVSHVVEAKKELAKIVHRFARLGVRLEDSLNCSFTVQHNSEPSFMVEVMSNQQLDKPLIELKKSVLGKIS